MSVEEKEPCLTPNTSSHSSTDSINNNDDVNINSDSVCGECSAEEVNIETNEHHDPRCEPFTRERDFRERGDNLVPRDSDTHCEPISNVKKSDVSNISEETIDVKDENNHNKVDKEIVGSENKCNESESNVPKKESVDSDIDNSNVTERTVSSVIESESRSSENEDTKEDENSKNKKVGYLKN